MQSANFPTCDRLDVGGKAYTEINICFKTAVISNQESHTYFHPKNVQAMEGQTGLKKFC